VERQHPASASPERAIIADAEREATGRETRRISEDETFAARSSMRYIGRDARIIPPITQLQFGRQDWDVLVCNKYFDP
jgi:hypothetical protein